MGRRKKSEDGGQVTAVEKKRKAVKTKRIEREHAGKVVSPYAMLEKLIKKLHPDLDEAKFVLFWKKGWRPDADGVLTAAKIKKASEVDKELDDFDFAVFLNFELWNETKISEEHKTIVIDRELCHALPEIDRDGEQKKDDRGRLCWRLRKFEITEFVAIIHRYGLEKVTGINDELIGALDDEKSRKEAEAEQNDAQRPMLKDTEEKAEKPSEAATATNAWRNHKVAVLRPSLTEKAFDALDGSVCRTLGELQDQMNSGGQFWAKNINVKGCFREAIQDAFNDYLIKHAG